jgi:uncharacterized membrane protein
MKSTQFAALAACFIAACESPTHPINVGEDLTALAAKPVAGPSITVTALPSLGGAARAKGINAGGTIVGLSIDAAGSENAVKWIFQSGAWTIAQLPDGLSGSAHAINAAGDIVGVKGDRAVFWPANGGNPSVLDCAGDGPDGALAINSGGTVAGYRDEGSLRRAVIWQPGDCLDGFSGAREDLPPLVVGQFAEARGINDAGTVTGMAIDATGNSRAVQWTFQNGAWEIQQLDDGTYAGAEGINNTGDIAGHGLPCTATPPCSAHAMFWPATGGKTDLGTLGGQVSVAFAINDVNEIVGWSSVFPKPSTRGFIWSAAAGMRALGPLKNDNHTEAYGINDAQAGSDGSRQVVGFSRARSGMQRAVVWKVP